jgi:protocatechuate 3,4-dioxygenase beta subunit
MDKMRRTLVSALISCIISIECSMACNYYETQSFPKNNNLLSAPGEKKIICGEEVIVHGVLMDKNCVPISDAKVYMWQVACDGKYPYIPLRDVDMNMINVTSRSTFKGAGTATTDNNGNFYFITTLPVAAGAESPHINLRIEHYNLGTFSTKASISKTHGKHRNISSSKILIVTPFVNQFREY